jgi:serine/threonine protein kinase
LYYDLSNTVALLDLDNLCVSGSEVDEVSFNILLSLRTISNNVQIGTCGYIAPELYATDVVTPKSDTFALAKKAINSSFPVQALQSEALFSKMLEPTPESRFGPSEVLNYLINWERDEDTKWTLIDIPKSGHPDNHSSERT